MYALAHVYSCVTLFGPLPTNNGQSTNKVAMMAKVPTNMPCNSYSLATQHSVECRLHKKSEFTLFLFHSKILKYVI